MTYLAVIRCRLSPACRWFGVFMLLLQVMEPAQPMLDGSGPSALAALFLEGLPICHAAEPGTQQPDAPSPHPAHDFQLCLACHGTSQAPFLPVTPVLVRIQGAAIRVAEAALPPATGPPARPWRRATPPVGPPPLSA